jgi:hypothetical protein
MSQSAVCCELPRQTHVSPKMFLPFIEVRPLGESHSKEQILQPKKHIHAAQIDVWESV